MACLKGIYSTLQPFEHLHLHDPNYLKWVRDYDVIKTLNKTDYLRPVSFDEVKFYCVNLMQSPSDMFYALYENELQKFIGTVRVAQINWRSRVADIGIMIGDKQFWGKGLASDAIKIICEYLFNKCGFRKLTSGFMANNPAMQKAFEKVGFKHEGTLRKQDYYEGEYIDHIYMGCFLEEFLKTE